MASATDVGIPEDIREVVKGAVTGMLQFVDAEVVPMEEEYRPILTDEPRFFHHLGQGLPQPARPSLFRGRPLAHAGLRQRWRPQGVPAVDHQRREDRLLRAERVRSWLP